MKKCKHCGAIQDDKRHRCIDCGERLPKPLDKKEAAEISANIENTLDKMSDRTEDFYVPLRDKIMGAISVLGIIAAIVLLIFVRCESSKIEASIPEGVIVDRGNGFTTIMSDGETEYEYPHAWKNRVDTAGTSGVISLVCFIFALPMLLIPKFMWFINTLKYRVFYGWDTSPSYFALVIRKIATYLLFACGVGCCLYGYLTLF